MPAFDVDATLFRVASMFITSEETRYYLNGVHIEPHEKGGVFLVATDGHRLFVAHDATGKIDGGTAIVQLGKDQLKACKLARGEDQPRRVVATDGKLPVTITAEGKPMSIQSDWLVDGTFPDWKRVMRGIRAEGHLDAVDAKYLKSFADAGEALTGSPRIEFSHVSNNGPAIIRFARVDNAVGVLMPVNWSGDGTRGWPSFLGFDPDPAPVDEADQAA